MTDSGPRIAATVRRFLYRSIANVEQLEVALLVQRFPNRFWDAAAVGEDLGLPERRAAAALEALAGQSLLDVRVGETLKYRFNPVTPEQRTAMRLLAELWREHRESLVRAVATKRRALRDFSDAFRLGPGDDDG